MKTIPILFTFDDSLVLPACVCMSSLLMNAAEDTFYDIFVLHSDRYDLSSTELMRIPDFFPNCRMTLRPVSGEFVGAYEVRGIPETCYYRLLSPELIPEYDKLLYSDVDVIFREDLSKYYETELGDCYFGAVDNGSALRPAMQRYITDTLHLDWRNGYFYSGNLIINSAQIRKDGMIARFRDLARNDYNQQDMDIINIACNGRIKRLSPAFCLSNYLYDLILDRREDMEKDFPSEELDHALNRGIVHYNGAKPWKGWCHHYDIWWEYYRRSPFFEDRFCRDFYKARSQDIENLTLGKRIKLLARYFIKSR